MTAITFGRLPGVPICETGTWQASTGEVTFTTEDFAAAIADRESCPAIRDAPIWLGHTSMKGKPTNGLPAIGWLDNLKTTNDGHTLQADFEGLPGWMVEADEDGNSFLGSAYPDRSIEGYHAMQCALGHTHQFVITGIALLGAEAPAVGVLTSLKDIAALWGLDVDDEGQPVAAARPTFILASRETVMPKPVLATVSDEDVRRAFYADAPWDEWIREVDIDPAQIIVQTDDGLVRRPYTISGDSIEFGDPVPVVTEYRDKTVAAQVAAAHQALGPRTVCATFATRETSRPADMSAPTTPAGPGGPAPTKKESAMDPIKLRESLGLAADASDVEVQAALATAGVIPKASEPTPEPAPTPEPEKPAEDPEGGDDLPEVVSIDRKTLEGLQVAATAGAQARAEQLTQRRTGLVDAAARDGRITIAQKAGWLKKLEAEGEAGEQVLASLAKGLVPVEAKGVEDSGEDIADEAFDAELERLGLKL